MSHQVSERVDYDSPAYNIVVLDESGHYRVVRWNQVLRKEEKPIEYFVSYFEACKQADNLNTFAAVHSD